MEGSEQIRRARQGEGAAWEALVREHQQAVFRFAYLLLGDPDQAEDVAQETFLRAFRALDRFDPQRPFRPWVLSIAANLARNQRRSAGRYIAALRRLVKEAPAGPASLEALASQHWEAQALWGAVRQLGFDDQQVIYYRFFLDLPVAETAQALGVAEGTVKSRLSRALERLRIVIARHYPALQEGRQA
ncbi:MAG TPA: sigma-70 family RNA polymerase sigma factor [Anaerolineales bacterium]|nr:sigma-70 family RNA polymerase sigma factor [Anaerolineales bacterium]